MEKKLVGPDYKNSIANLPNSVLKYFGVQTVGDTLPLLDRYLGVEYKNVVVLLLDGMGISILERHLAEDGAFRSHLAGTYKSVFLSTTVAATTSAMSGLQPCEHSWLGWDCYYPQLDKNVTVFSNTVQGTEEPAAEYHAAHTFTPYESVDEKINKAGGKAYKVMPFVPPYPNSIEEICTEIKRICAEPEKKYIYAYWKQPDGLLHKYGCSSQIVREDMGNAERVVAELAESLDDTLFVVTADHGHADTEHALIRDYPRICDCLVRMPSLEPRVLNFFVKDGRKEEFEREFNKEFSDKFKLVTVEEAIKEELFGTGKHHEMFRAMLGDYIAIATGDLSIFFSEEAILHSMHGSLTEEEMMIPLIVFGS